MLVNRRKNRIFERKIIAIFLFLLLTFSAVFTYYFFFLKEASIVSPIPRSNAVKVSDLGLYLKKYDISFESILVAADSSYVVLLNQDRQVIISSQKEIIQQVSSLQRILRALTIEGKGFKSIDFSYNKPVITYE